ncbi:MAG: ParA family protein, partial [bacterium]|nr:ParA family protein [bacterium]
MTNQAKRKLKTIGLFNEKGGVGKSTIATHIAAGLALRGATVVLIDTDPQGNATSAL